MKPTVARLKKQWWILCKNGGVAVVHPSRHKRERLYDQRSRDVVDARATTYVTALAPGYRKHPDAVERVIRGLPVASSRGRFATEVATVIGTVDDVVRNAKARGCRLMPKAWGPNEVHAPRKRR